MKTSKEKEVKNIEGSLKIRERILMEEELDRPRVEVWFDPDYDDWAEWVRSHERKKMGNPVDICEMMIGMKASPLCPLGSH